VYSPIKNSGPLSKSVLRNNLTELSLHQKSCIRMSLLDVIFECQITPNSGIESQNWTVSSMLLMDLPELSSTVWNPDIMVDQTIVG